MDFIFAGGAMEVGGSCIFVKAGEHRILMDAGIRQGGSKDPVPDFRSIQMAGGVDVILISHAHMDHIGSLPVISKAYPAAPIYMTKMTADLSRVLLYDSLKIMDRREDEIPFYSEPDVKNMLSRIRIVRYLSPMEIMQGVTVTMYPAGHIAGAACIYINTQEGTLFYSGDVSNFSQRTIEGTRIPKLRPDIAILESTYGNRIHSNRQAEERRLVQLVAEHVREKSQILIPAFALGRAQEVLLILRSAIQNKEIPPVPVYVDGMVRDINRMYTMNPTFLKNALAKRILKGQEPFYTEQIQEVKPSWNREEIFAKGGPSIFVSSSGMLTGGPSLLYAKKLLPMENACLIITGYQDEEAPGRALLNLLEKKEEEKKITLDGQAIPVRCRIEQVGLSAHGDQSELCGIIERISARKVILVHGDGEAIAELGENLTSDIRRQIYRPSCGDQLSIEIRNKRKQMVFSLPYSMQKAAGDAFSIPSEKQMKEFWDYWKEHYENRSLTVEQAAYIWSGRKQFEDEWLYQFQEALADGPYFSRDLKRLFLLRPNTEEEILEKQKKAEITPQDIETWVRENYQEQKIRKLGFYLSEKKVVLSFDFPDTVDMEKFLKCAAQLEKTYGWTMTINSAVNHQAAAGLIQSMFGIRLLKTSYYEMKKEYHITINPDGKTSKKEAEEFYQKTGWRLYINGASGAAEKRKETVKERITETALKDGWFVPKQVSEQLEQNLAFSCVEQSFGSPDVKQGHAPYKMGLKNDADGKYMELSFLSPELGKRYAGLLQAVADQIGWRVHIAESVNQNALTSMAMELCEKYHIGLSKNPSYLAQSQTIRLKCTDPLELPKDMEQEFFEKTGCQIIGTAAN